MPVLDQISQNLHVFGYQTKRYQSLNHKQAHQNAGGRDHIIIYMCNIYTDV